MLISMPDDTQQLKAIPISNAALRLHCCSFLLQRGQGTSRGHPQIWNDYDGTTWLDGVKWVSELFVFFDVIQKIQSALCALLRTVLDEVLSAVSFHTAIHFTGLKLKQRIESRRIQHAHCCSNIQIYLNTINEEEQKLNQMWYCNNSCCKGNNILEQRHWYLIQY